jgi:prefoldin subunit 5
MKLESLEQRYRELDSRVQNVEAQIQVLQEFQRNYEAMRPEY